MTPCRRYVLPALTLLAIARDAVESIDLFFPQAPVRELRSIVVGDVRLAARGTR